MILSYEQMAVKCSAGSYSRPLSEFWIFQFFIIVGIKSERYFWWMVVNCLFIISDWKYSRDICSDLVGQDAEKNSSRSNALV